MPLANSILKLCDLYLIEVRSKRGSKTSPKIVRYNLKVPSGYKKWMLVFKVKQIKNKIKQMCFRWSLFNYFFCYSYWRAPHRNFFAFLTKKLNCLQMDTWTWRQAGNPYRKNMRNTRKVHSNNTCYSFLGGSTKYHVKFLQY